MKLKLVALTLVVVLLIGGFRQADAAPLPTIVTFESSLEAVSLADVEAGTATTTLSWHTVGLTADYRLTLHSYRLNAWKLAFDQTSVPLEATGARVVTIQAPLNFGPPTYLLSIVDAQSRIVDQRTVTIPYEDVSEAAVIDTFTTDLESVDANELAQNTARVTVSWDVSNRPATANLVFEQVFADDSVVSVELPREYLWIPSGGQGVVAPILREGETEVRLRLRLVDLVADETLAEAEITLTITGTVAAVPAQPAQPAAPQQPVVIAPPIQTGPIVSFVAAPDTVNPGAAVELRWHVQGTGGVYIEQSVPNTTASTVVLNAQSPQGSTTVYLPDFAAYSVTYTLWTADRSASAQASVQVHCPYTFFFGSADGCPSTDPLTVSAVYQAFERGHMLYRQDTREVYVHYKDGPGAYYLAATYENLPVSLGEDMPPLERYAPTDILGRVWTNAPGVKDRLGWALSPETPYQMTLQQVATTRQPAPQYLFYMTLPDSSVIGTGFGTWRTVK